MTDDQRERLNRFLAEWVMGWTEGEYEHDRVYRSAEGIECFAAHWNPLQLMRDCTLLLDKIEQDGWEWQFKREVGLYQFTLYMAETCMNLTSAVSDSRTEALCLAIARAYSWKEEV